ncbi:MAG: type III-B CRISPR module-associated Cmr3 family protein [Bryobacteraceae bacterium]
MERTLLIQPRDPAIFRDGKPFTAGAPARSIPWPMPSAVIGAIRTRLGRLTSYDNETIKRLRKIEQCGPFLAAKSNVSFALAFPAPADAVAFAAADGKLDICPLRPEELKGCDGMDTPGGLPPVLMDRDGKPAEMPPFWSGKWTMEWLAAGGRSSVRCSPAEIGLGGLRRQRRIHVKIEAGSQTAEKGMLFGTEGLEFEDNAICSKIRYGDEEEWAPLEHLAPLGADRRLAYWWEQTIDWPVAPEWLAESRLVRLQLVTPGCFAEGWKPEWMTHGTPPGLDGLELSLVAAVVPRAAALSGWDLTKRGKRGEKATRFLAPAGSVYFCEVKRGDPRRLWLRSIADKEQDQRDGFGLVLCGVWQWR